MRHPVAHRPSEPPPGGAVAATIRSVGGDCRPRRCRRLALMVLLVAAPLAAAEEPQRWLGASSCASVGCHAAAEAGHAPWQSALTTWITRDPHAAAARALEGALAERIVAAIALRDGAPQPPATSHPACIACHAPAPAAWARDGVSCEQCHGPAGEWVVAHTLPGWKTRGNAAGMVDLADPATCARTCTPCHVGAPPRADGATFEVSHDLVAAGHPRLAFELRSFKQGQPPHWRDRVALAAAGTIPADSVDPLGEWATGRVVALEAYLDQVARQAGAGAGPEGVAGTWPELAAFDCYGCHRQSVAAADRGQPVAPSRGRVRLQPAAWALVDIAVPDAAAELGRLRDGIERDWWCAPDAPVVRGAVETLATAPRLTGAGPAIRALAERAVAATDAATWDEAVVTLSLLEALLDHTRVRGAPAERTAAAAAALVDVRRLLAFEATGTGATRVRVNSPRGHDPSAVRGALAAAAARLAELGN